MKTLDEVIKAFDICTNSKGCKNCPYAVYDEDGFEMYLECSKKDTDALQYLKNYKEMIDSLAKAIIEAYEKIKPLIEDENENA